MADHSHSCCSNTFYKALSFQSLYWASEVGLRPDLSHRIESIGFRVASRPGANLNHVRVAYRLVESTQSQLQAPATTSQISGPQSLSNNDLPASSWVDLQLPLAPTPQATDGIYWPFDKHLIVEISHDQAAIAPGGGAYMVDTGRYSRSTRRFADDWGSDYPYPATGSLRFDTKVLQTRFWRTTFGGRPGCGFVGTSPPARAAVWQDLSSSTSGASDCLQIDVPSCRSHSAIVPVNPGILPAWARAQAGFTGTREGLLVIGGRGYSLADGPLVFNDVWWYDTSSHQWVLLIGNDCGSALASSSEILASSFRC